MFYAERNSTDPSGIDGVEAAAEVYVLRHLQLLDEAVGGGPFLLGPELMGVDCLIWTVLSWLERETVEPIAPRLLMLADAVASDSSLVSVSARHL